MQSETGGRQAPALASAWIFLGINLATSLLFGGLAFALQEQLKQLVGLVFIPLMFIPLITAYALHRRDGGGGPFKGLVWGPTAWYWLLAAGGFAWAAVVVGVQVLLGLAGIDTTMSYYVQQVMDMSAEMGNPIPESAASALSLQGWITAGLALVFGPWVGAAAGCLSSFPLLGFAFRRMLVQGRVTAILQLMAYAALVSSVAGLIDNPNLGDADMPLRIGLFVLNGLAGIPVMVWLFLRTRSAVLPALMTASYTSGLTAASPFLSDYSAWLCAPSGGLVASAGSLLLGLALWVWQDPGSGQNLALAAVAHDGTALSPEQLHNVQQAANQAAAQDEPADSSAG